MPRPTKAIRELRVVLDTSVLFTKVASDLVSTETTQLIRDNTNHPDMKVLWYLPDTVVEERAFQMRKAGSALLPNLEKVERLLGHNLGINQATLDDRVKATIVQQITSLNLSTPKLDISKVDWQKIINASLRREPPFEDNEKEKGFRDALIAETFLQIVESSPRTPAKCRIAFVTGDPLLADAVKPRLASYSNAQVLSSLDDLKGFINTLASQVDESFVLEIQKKASALFFLDATTKDALYYKENIAEKIKQEYSEELAKLPEGAEFREHDGILIGSPRFVRKEGQRMHWVSRIRFKANAYRWIDAPSSPSPVGLRAGSSSALAQGGLGLLSTALTRDKQLTHTVNWIFDVRWSLTVDNKRKLSRASIDGIDYVEMNW